jgi:iron complex transport system substrate-binding protein
MASARIVSLLPSATEIVGALGLADQLVGVTHECDVCPDVAGMRRLVERGVERVTTSQINPHELSQGAIDEAVKQSLSSGISLYELREDALRRARPTLILTQALCSVCAPAHEEVQAVCRRLGAALANEQGEEPQVINLEPATLADVAETFVTVATASGVAECGSALRQRFEETLQALRALTARAPRPKVLLLEWLEPPFNAGHWVSEQIEAAGGHSVAGTAGRPSRQLSWDELEAEDPDVIAVACCGFDLARNLTDAGALLSKSCASEAARRLSALRAVKEGRLYALDGNRYFARPSPSLAGGAAVLARVIHDGRTSLVSELESLGFLPAEGKAWSRVSVTPVSQVSPGAKRASFTELHEQACSAGELTYVDPDTGYRVFTRLGLERRGSCCGCGCRHCPYGHVNVVDKAARIQQPAFLHRRATTPREGQPRHVLFWSGGKDSLLALRAWLRSRLEQGSQTALEVLDSLVLLTTFDAATRVVAHQEVSIAEIERQARSLELDLVGVPLHPGMEYLERVRLGLERVTREGGRVESLVFGDLHLSHIKEWRDGALSHFGAVLDFPLWQVDQETLLGDLMSSQVPCVISACPGSPAQPSAEGVQIGRPFDRRLVEAAKRAGWDSFGENGEFHTLAQVWRVPADRALGIDGERDRGGLAS